MTPLSVTTRWSVTVAATLPPLAAAMSTTIEPGCIAATVSAVMSCGAGRPGISAVVMTMSAARASSSYIAAVAASCSAVISLA